VHLNTTMPSRTASWNTFCLTHQCVWGNTVQLAPEVSMHVPGPPQGVAKARWDKDTPASQTLL
jgi:hypothetical protein